PRDWAVLAAMTTAATRDLNRFAVQFLYLCSKLGTLLRALVIMVNLPCIVNEKVIRSQVTSNPSAVQRVPRQLGSANERTLIMAISSSRCRQKYDVKSRRGGKHECGV